MTPTRLAVYEDFAAVVQLRARSNGGSFDAAGEYGAFAGGERIIAQDLAASFRFSRSGQAGAVLPVIETHRTAGDLSDFGVGVGDVSLTLRYDVLLPSEVRYFPGLSALAAVTLPTGKAPNQAVHPLGDGTGEPEHPRDIYFLTAWSINGESSGGRSTAWLR